MGLDLRAERKIDWAAPPGCPKGFEPRQVYAGRAEVGGTPIEVAVAKWAGPDRVTREAMAKLHALRVNKRAAEEKTPRQKVDALLQFVTETGLPIPEQPQPLPAISRNDIRVVCWMAVQPEGEDS